MRARETKCERGREERGGIEISAEILLRSWHCGRGPRDIVEWSEKEVSGEREREAKEEEEIDYRIRIASARAMAVFLGFSGRCAREFSSVGENAALGCCSLIFS